MTNIKTRTDIINALIKKHGYKTYLEIGVQNGRNFHAIDIDIKNKTGVDPDVNSKATQYMTSDDFFEKAFTWKHKYDIIFIDGLHEYKQVLRDIQNALKCLSPNGTIVCHDMNPLSREMQAVPREQVEWTGDCWKAWVYLRLNKHFLNMRVVDTDYGCGVINKSKEHFTLSVFKQDVTFDNFVIHKTEWLNLVTVEEFCSIENL